MAREASEEASVVWCFLRRKWENRRPLTPLERIEGKGCFGWLKKKFDPFGAKVMSCDHLLEDRSDRNNYTCNL
ncbi:putative calcium-binding protein CML15 [Senna tora]|uniref:Putative calcium-binding protein CML15 n=1 Tax=Senna tora TaxID=362788 RepID=A0A835CEK9_9FABA|nr:putative calcium-binding protein CML15 [Senna tora]